MLMENKIQKKIYRSENVFNLKNVFFLVGDGDGRLALTFYTFIYGEVVSVIYIYIYIFILSVH